MRFRGIGYFQNLRNFLRNCLKTFLEFFDFFFFGIIWNFLEFFLKLFGNSSEGFFWRSFFGGIFLEEFFGRNFLVGFLGGFLEDCFLEEFFGRDSLFYFSLEGIDLFVEILVFIKSLSKSRRRKEGGQKGLIILPTVGRVLADFWVPNEIDNLNFQHMLLF